MPKKNILHEFFHKEALDNAPPPARVFNSALHLGAELAMARYLSFPLTAAMEAGGMADDLTRDYFNNRIEKQKAIDETRDGQKVPTTSLSEMMAMTAYDEVQLRPAESMEMESIRYGQVLFAGIGMPRQALHMALDSIHAAGHWVSHKISSGDLHFRSHEEAVRALQQSRNRYRAGAVMPISYDLPKGTIHTDIITPTESDQVATHHSVGLPDEFYRIFELSPLDPIDKIAPKIQADIKSSHSKILNVIATDIQQMNDLARGVAAGDSQEEEFKAFSDHMQKLGKKVQDITEVCAQSIKFLTKDKQQAAHFKAFGTGVQYLANSLIAFKKTDRWGGAEQIGHFAGAMVGIFGRKKEAQFVTRAVPAASKVFSGLKHLTSGNWLGGAMSLFSGFGSLFGGDSDNSEEVLAAVANVEHKVDTLTSITIENFCRVIDYQGKTLLMISETDNRNQQRFEATQMLIHYACQELTRQNEHIRQQIVFLAEQHEDRFQRTLSALRTVQTNMLNTINSLREMTESGLILLEKKATENHLALTAHIARSQIENTQYFNWLISQNEALQRKNDNLLVTAQDSRETTLNLTHERHQVDWKTTYEKVTQKSLTFVFESPEGQKNSLPELRQALRECSDPVLTGGHIDTERAGSILALTGRERHWKKPDPFSALNLLREVHCPEDELPLSHPTPLMQNIRSLMAHWQQSELPETDWLTDWTFARDALAQNRTFATTLGQPEKFTSMLKKAGDNAQQFWMQAKIILREWQKLHLADIKHALLTRSALQKTRLEETMMQYPDTVLQRFGNAYIAHKQAIDMLQWDMPGEALDTHDYTTPSAWFVSPKDRKQDIPALPAPLDKFPNLPESLLQLEAMGAGYIGFYASYHQNNQGESTLTVWPVFHATDDAECLDFSDMACIIPVENEAGSTRRERILRAWTCYQDVAPAFSLDQRTDLNIRLSHHVARLQQNMNLRLIHAMRDELVPYCDRMDADAALIHLAFRLAFDSFCDDVTHPLYQVLMNLQTSSRIQQALREGSIPCPHPASRPENQAAHYEELAEMLTDAVSKRILHPENRVLDEALAELESFRFSRKPGVTEHDLCAWVDEMQGIHPKAIFSLLIYAAELAFTNQWNTSALAFYNQAQRLQSDNNAIREKRAICYERLSQPANAAAVYMEILAEITAFCERIADSAISGQESISDKLLSEITLHLYAMLKNTGRMLHQAGHLRAALASLGEAEQLIAHDPDLAHCKARIYEDLHDWDRALVCYKDALGEEKDCMDYRLGEARCYRLTGRTAEARETYFHLLRDDHPERADCQYHCAMLSIELHMNRSREEKENIEKWLNAYVRYQHGKIHDDETIQNLRNCSDVLKKIHSVYATNALLTLGKFAQKPKISHEDRVNQYLERARMMRNPH